MGKKENWNELKCVIKSTCLVTSLHLVQAIPKKDQQEKIYSCTLDKGQLPTRLM